MFSRPFVNFDPGAAEVEAGTTTRELIVRRVQRCIDAGIIDGNEVDIAHGLNRSLAQGLAAQEAAGWLGSTASVNRRWDLAVHAFLAGLSAERSQ